MVMNTHRYFHGLCFNWKCLQEKGISTVCDLKQISWAFCALRPCQWMHEANRNKGTPSAVYLCIHFMIWKELDFTKIGICSNTKNLCLEAQTSVVSYHMQRVEMIDSLKPERRWRHCPCPMTPPAAAGLVSSDIWSHCQGTDGWLLYHLVPLLTEARCHPFSAAGWHQKSLCEPPLETSKTECHFRMSGAFFPGETLMLVLREYVWLLFGSFGEEWRFVAIVMSRPSVSSSARAGVRDSVLFLS